MLPEEPIDEAVLDQLESLRPNDPNFVSKIIRLYLDTMPSMLKELETAALADDVNWLRLANHSLYSASAAVGAVRVSARCNELDRMLRTGPVAGAVDWAKIIIEEYHRAEAALRSCLACREPR
jgi:HPt (histidine-containing phosphotransfer) domain-containing protein